jgi:signal transduction histidine kinase
MTLINKTTRSFLVASLFASICGAILCFVLLKKIVKDEATEQLLREKIKFEEYIDEKGKLPETFFELSERVNIVPSNQFYKPYFSDTTFFHKKANEFHDYRKITFTVKVIQNWYKVSILKPLFEADELLTALLLTFGFLILLLVGLLFTVNYVLSRKIWQPFYQTLSTLQTFQISQRDELYFEKTDITEFRTLQKELQILTEQVRREYQSLKTFTENASHELQTPLAVISSNLELLLQDSNLTDIQMQQISSLIESIGKLSKLNQTLLLLTKIENRQFDDRKIIDFSELVLKKIDLLDVWIKHKSLTVSKSITPNVNLQINAYLADVLLNNIFGNAIKYNILLGDLFIELTDKRFIIKNTGKPLSVLPENLFGRFQKDSSQSDSLGLGLALVKQICDTYNFKVNYSFQENLHALTIEF